MYDAHNNCPHRHEYYPNKTRKAEQPKVILDLIINIAKVCCKAYLLDVYLTNAVEQFERRTGTEAPATEVPRHKRRTNSPQGTSKRPRYDQSAQGAYQSRSLLSARLMFSRRSSGSASCLNIRSKPSPHTEDIPWRRHHSRDFTARS